MNLTSELKIQPLADQFFELCSVNSLNTFLSQLDTTDPYQAAWLRYASSWPAHDAENPDAPFNPRAHMTEDLSAAMFGECPCIFLGTNDWALRAVATADELRTKVRNLANHIRGIRDRYIDRTMVLIVVPEKDYLIDHVFLKSGNYFGMCEIMRELSGLLQELGIVLLFEQPISGLEDYQVIADFTYRDSHLPTLNYIQIFAAAIEAFGHDWQSVREHLRLAAREVYFDLVAKLDESQPNPHTVSSPFFDAAEVSLVAGSDNFRSPLGDTWQLNRNTVPIVGKKILLLGDSHSSIFSQRKLNYLFGCTFAETEFHWNPCCVRSTIPETDADYIVLEISQRFVF